MKPNNGGLHFPAWCGPPPRPHSTGQHGRIPTRTKQVLGTRGTEGWRAKNKPRSSIQFRAETIHATPAGIPGLG